MAITAAVTVSGAIATYVGLRIFPIEKELRDRKTDRQREADALERRLQGLHDDAKEVRDRFEHRLATIEQSYISRIELERTMNAIGDRMDRGVARVEASVGILSAKMENLSERIAKVEVSP